MTGRIFSIEEFSIYDGPGIRTSVFLKGCPLKCNWCHNPEGQNSDIQIVRSPNGCTGCNSCIQNADKKDGMIVFTEDSIKNCPNNLLRVCGEDYSVPDLCNILLKNERILKNGGGITFSGGEPFIQSKFLFACLEFLKGKLHTAIQTCGYCSENIFAKALDLADYFLFDLKIIDNSLHQRYTGVSNQKILKNFSHLVNSSAEFVVRTPLIPGVTDTEKNIWDIAKLLSDKGINYIELLPYNKMAGGKYKMLLREYTPDFDESIPVNTRKEIFDSFNIEIKVL